jgi:hypothetical protein
MIRKIFMTMVTLAFVLGSLGLSFADEGNGRKGKYTYRKVYKACNERGEAASAKPPISPDEKTQAQWKRIFDKKDFEDFGCKQEWDALSENDLLDIFTYLYEHAADSPSPAKCQ